MMPTTARRPEPETPLGTMPFWLVQWPMIAFTGWWDAAFDAWHPDGRAHLIGAAPDLTVPEPLEHDGEHALFA